MRVVDSMLRACCGGRITPSVSHRGEVLGTLDILESSLYYAGMAFLMSLVVGLGVGGLYAVLEVRSPAPPAVALLGLLGMVVGEYVVIHLRS
jgi:XapX domain-containing protein